jgi:hypothetical protein
MAYIGNPLVNTSFVTDVFTGDNVTTAFTLSRTPASVTSIVAFIDGVKQASIGGSGAYTPQRHDSKTLLLHHQIMLSLRSFI